MRNKLLASAAAIALAMSIGAASAAEMSMLKGISAEPMTAHEMALVQGLGKPTAAFFPIIVPSAAETGVENTPIPAPVGGAASVLNINPGSPFGNPGGHSNVHR